MTQTLFAYGLIFLLIIAALPLALVCLRQGESPVSLSLAVSMSLAIFGGAISLIMLVQGMTGLQFSALSVLIPYGALCAGGIFAWWRKKARITVPKLDRWRWPALIILVSISGAILFNAVNLPFYRDDTLGIYQPQALELFQTGWLIPLTGADSLYKTYPMLMQLNYAYVYLISGWENDYLAKVVSALISIGCLIAAYHLGQLARGDGTGWVAALLLALTPTFGKWASSGYVDLPMAFFYALSGVFALRLWYSGRTNDALLAGAMMGLAAWTKNAALLGIVLLSLWLLWVRLKGRISWRDVAISLVACLLVALPWYIRNVAEAGFLVPNTAWTDQAERSLENLLVFVAKPENFGFTGLIFILGVISAVITVIRKRLNAPAELLLLLWTVPFFAAWWLFASYDPRFLLLYLPPLAALGGVFLMRVWSALPLKWQGYSRTAAAIVVSLFALFILWNSVDYKDELLRQPFMTDGERRELVGRGVSETLQP
jgi:4-amino-4-deoxy-L-arabinose transferase-like glycosyltransferase